MDRESINKLQQSFGILGEAEEIKEVIETIDQIATTDITVLISGESGTGKELVANALHRHSHRKHNSFVKVNCGAIPAGIIESELFGHVKGSFTGAIADRKGYFETANHGTIFLDEIGEMPMETQVKLLRVLELGEFIPVGGSEIKKTDVRIIAATNKNLKEEVEKNNFRRDLYYRIKTITIHLIPLRKHPEDIPLLVNKFAIDFANRNSIPFKGFSPRAMELLKKYHWSGNVRELKNFVESIIVLEKGQVITGSMIEKRLFVEEERTSPNLPVRLSINPEQAERELILQQIFMLRREMREIKEILGLQLFDLNHSNLKDHTRVPISHYISLPPKIDEGSENYKDDKEQSIIDSEMVGKVSLQEVEKELIEKTLKKFDYKKRQTANALRISERTLYRKIKEYGL
jgi:DNA-binding NtrC family response regulator